MGQQGNQFAEDFGRALAEDTPERDTIQATEYESELFRHLEIYIKDVADSTVDLTNTLAGIKKSQSLIRAVVLILETDGFILDDEKRRQMDAALKAPDFISVEKEL